MANMHVSCFIPGNQNTFTVDIEATQKVKHLKKRITEEKPMTLANVEADDLVLYQVTIKEDLDEEPRIEELERLYKEKESRTFSEGEPLRRYFGKSPPPGLEYHIIVQIPKGESIYCRGVPNHISL